MATPAESNTASDFRIYAVWNFLWWFGFLVFGSFAFAADDPPRDWIDPATGHRVIRLSAEPGSSSLYFHQNAYTSEGDKMVITTPDGIATVNLTTRHLDLVVSNLQYFGGSSSGLEVGRKTRTVYYSRRVDTQTVVYATHLDTKVSREIAKLPFRGTFGGVNADETKLVGACSERRERSARGARSMRLFSVDIATGAIDTFHPSTNWLNHVQCSPADPALVLFCHEGDWHNVDRVWTIRVGSDIPKLMHRRTMPYEIAGHEFFSRDGQWVWYDLQTPRSKEFWLAGVHLETGERVRYPIQRDQWSVHYSISWDGQLFAGDGGGTNSVANHTPLPKRRRLHPPANGQWIYLFRPKSGEFETIKVDGQPVRIGKLEPEKLVDLSRHDYDFEPNATFTPDNRWIVFRSNMHGTRHVYAVEVSNPR
jgi:oligogalacturonide lyase